MAVKINITVQTQQVDARIKQLQAAGANLQPVWQLVGNFLVNRIRLLFRFSRDPWGAPWLPIKWRAPRVAARFKAFAGPTQPGAGRMGAFTRRRDRAGNLVLTKAGQQQLNANATGKVGQPLVDTGRLRRSIVAKATGSEVRVGTNLKHARTHQFGAIITPKKKPLLAFPGPNGEFIFSKRVKVPARPFMPINIAGQIDLPTSWASNIIRTLAAHFKLGASSPQGVPT